MENDKTAQKEQGQNAMLAQIAQQIASQRGGISNLAAAFVKAKQDISNPEKNAANPHFGNNYADLPAVLSCFTPAFNANDLALIQAPGEIRDGNVAVIGLLVHKSGESIQFRTELPLGPKATAQAAGSAITYARRYQAAAIAGVAQVDDDGQSASEEPKAAKGSKSKAAPSEYPAEEDALIAKIKAASRADLKTLKPQIVELGSQKAATAYSERLTKLKEEEGAAQS